MCSVKHQTVRESIGTAAYSAGAKTHSRNVFGDLFSDSGESRGASALGRKGLVTRNE
jgi:hypothetical protein